MLLERCQRTVVEASEALGRGTMTNPFLRKLEYGAKLTDDDRQLIEQELREQSLIRTDARQVVVIPDMKALESLAQSDPNYLHLRDRKVPKQSTIHEELPS